MRYGMSSIDSLPDGPLLLLANEFLDALPIRQFVRHGGAWKERYVEHGEFVEIETGGEPADVSDGTIFEICDPARTFAHAVGARVAHEGGAALFVDYGYEGSGAVDTLQAIRGAGFVNPLDEPGSADLTAHVDFQAVAAAARSAGAAVHGPVPQGIFLARLGLFQRTDRLARGKPPREAAYLIEAARRLAEPDRMGRLFKALAICHPGAALPPGFEPEATRPMMQPNSSPEPLTAPRCRPGTASSPVRGGVSGGPFASLNCNLSGQDSREAVLENRARASRACARHRSRPPARADSGARRGSGRRDRSVARRAGPRADAMVTDRPGLALGIITADCAPMLLADPEAGVIGAAHAGWRGAVDGRAGGDCRGHGGTWARARPESPPRSARASARPRTRWRRICATLCFGRTRRRTAASSRPGSARTAGNSISAGYCGSRLMLAGVDADRAHRGRHGRR